MHDETNRATGCGATRKVIPDRPATVAVLVALGLALVAGCSPLALRTAITEARSSTTELIEEQTGTRSRALVEVRDAPYLDDTRVAHSEAAWLNEQVEIRVAEMPFDLCLARALEQLSREPSVAFAPDFADLSVPVTLDHDGPFRGFLTLLADASGYGWEERGGALHWMANITRTFDIHRAPGDLRIAMSTVSQGQSTAIGGAGGGGGGGGGGGAGQGGSSNVQAGPKSSGQLNLGASFNFWDDLHNTVISLLGDSGESMIDRTTGTIVVRGPAHRVREAGRYIDALNRWLQRQVLLEIQLVTVALSDQFSSGIDWRLVRLEGDLRPVAESTFAQSAAETLATAPGIFGVEFAGESENAGTSIIMRALASQGQTSVRKHPRIVALNGQATQLQVLNDKAILGSVDRIDRETETGLERQVLIQPSIVSTGISLTVVPKIVGERVFLYANILVSELVDLQAAGRGEQTIQLPTVDRNQFFQAVRLRSGETLALGGLLADSAARDQRSLPRLGWMGARDLDSRRTETVLLITPTLLDAPAPDEDLLL